MENELGKSDSNSELPDIPKEEVDRIVEAMMKTLEMGIGAVYGHEEDDVPVAKVDCSARLQQCKSICCTLQFALT